MKFNRTIGIDELDIRDGKYVRDMKPILIWEVSKNGKSLVIKFKPGMGDFGSGNDVTVRINGSAFTTNPEQTYVFALSTDRL
ncbi:MAG TPA: hypothetical protein VKS81_08200 [Bacteroidota bacterium]|nr:hypothetical protein [Bacteroidota bacterium]